VRHRPQVPPGLHPPHRRAGAPEGGRALHWDDFTLPWDEAPKQLPGVDVEGFVEEIRAAGAEAVVLGLGQTWRW
jgi:hypothetical protein